MSSWNSLRARSNSRAPPRFVRHGGTVFLQLVLLGLQALLLSLQGAFARRELRPHGIEHGLALWGLLQEPVRVDDTDLGFRPGRQRGQRDAYCHQPHCQLAADQTLHGTFTSYAI